jgi:hypothetical protein
MIKSRAVNHNTKATKKTYSQHFWPVLLLFATKLADYLPLRILFIIIKFI